MCSIARTRSLDCRREPDVLTRLDESTYVVDARALVEVYRQKPAGLILKKRIDAHHVSAREVADYCGIVERDEGLIRAVAALDLG
jgi:hypothetical protein